MSATKINCCIGIDTSNYTTSVGLYCENGTYINSRKILPVPSGLCGLRQSDAVFEHVRQFPSVFSAAGVSCYNIKGVAVSSRPRNVEGSYMPCFLYGLSVAQTVSAAFDVPLIEFSHQQGHIAAGIVSSDRKDLLAAPFYAFHASGGTTELLLVNSIDDIKVAAKSLDISVGQLVDRTGVLLGLDFPCGRGLEALADGGKMPEKPRIKLKDGNCCLSGFENKVMKMRDNGVSPADIAFYTLNTVADVVCKMVEKANTQNLPVLFVGGVMSDMIIRNKLTDHFCGLDISFASTDLSSDNAVGIAYLGYRSLYE